LKSARMAGLQNDSILPALRKAAEALKLRITQTEGARHDAPAVYALQLIGYVNDPLVRFAAERLKGMTMDWENPEFENPIYFWYFTTQAKFRHGGQVWNEWNRAFAPVLVREQIVEEYKAEKQVGYWISPGKKERYGKVYSSALCCLMFGNYSAWQRPFYDPDLVEPEEDEDIEINITL
jgi:hypothetical protein